jgi:hypothetical protein
MNSWRYQENIGRVSNVSVGLFVFVLDEQLEMSRKFCGGSGMIVLSCLLLRRMNSLKCHESVLGDFNFVLSKKCDCYNRIRFER